MRKVIFIFLVLLMGLGPGCQPDTPAERLRPVLTSSWQSYGRRFIKADGQVMIPEYGDGTISEAQAYALLRAVWAQDPATFNRVYAWTYRHLSRVRSHGDHLLSWLWVRRPDGSWGVMDANSATDADLDYALALSLAHRRGWRAPPGLPDLGAEARRVQADILAREVVALPDGNLLLTPGNWHAAAPPYLVNPSYFSPGAYRIFARGGPGAPGSPGKTPATPSPQGLKQVFAATGYSRLHASTYNLLDRLGRGFPDNPGVGLFPDWCQITASGRFTPAPHRDIRFGWEAVRLPFRLALDKLWFGDTRGARLLSERFLPFFKARWQAHGRLQAVYSYDGAPAVAYESPVLYAGVLAAALTAGDQDFAKEMAGKVLSFYHKDGDRAYFESPDKYYPNNWAWLGLALYAGWVVPGN